MVTGVQRLHKNDEKYKRFLLNVFNHYKADSLFKQAQKCGVKGIIQNITNSWQDGNFDRKKHKSEEIR